MKKILWQLFGVSLAAATLSFFHLSISAYILLAIAALGILIENQMFKLFRGQQDLIEDLKQEVASCNRKIDQLALDIRDRDD